MFEIQNIQKCPVENILGTVLLDFDADACQSPSRAYLLDVTLPGRKLLPIMLLADFPPVFHHICMVFALILDNNNIVSFICQIICH